MSCHSPARLAQLLLRQQCRRGGNARFVRPCTLHALDDQPIRPAAYIEHDYDRAVILDFDLHHGNGTQSIVMSLNEASRRDALLVEGGKPLHALSEEERECQRRKRAWTGFYGSLHDIVCPVGLLARKGAQHLEFTVQLPLRGAGLPGGVVCVY